MQIPPAESVAVADYIAHKIHQLYGRKPGLRHTEAIRLDEDAVLKTVALTGLGVRVPLLPPFSGERIHAISPLLIRRCDAMRRPPDVMHSSSEVERSPVKRSVIGSIPICAANTKVITHLKKENDHVREIP